MTSIYQGSVKKLIVYWLAALAIILLSWIVGLNIPTAPRGYHILPMFVIPLFALIGVIAYSILWNKQRKETLEKANIPTEEV